MKFRTEILADVASDVDNGCTYLLLLVSVWRLSRGMEGGSVVTT